MSDLILYTFRRCPYAIRARYALHYADIAYEHREVVLRDKPAHMLEISPKGTVPVLYMEKTKQVIDESLDIMLWALSQNDPKNRLGPPALRSDIYTLIERNDSTFKDLLDRYKYPNKYNEGATGTEARDKAKGILKDLNLRIEKNGFLSGHDITLADMAIFPFIRQFAHVDRSWFYEQPHKNLTQWLDYFKDSKRFNAIMRKHDTYISQESIINQDIEK